LTKKFRTMLKKQFEIKKNEVITFIYRFLHFYLCKFYVKVKLGFYRPHVIMHFMAMLYSSTGNHCMFFNELTL